MPAHPNLPEKDADQIVQYILSLSGQGNVQKSLPASGTLTPPANLKPNTSLIIAASYTDKGGNNIKSLTGRSTVVLQGNTLSFNGKEEVKNFTAANYEGSNYLVLPKEEGWFKLDSIDLYGVRSIDLLIGWQTPPEYGYDFEIRLGSPDGATIGKGTLSPQKNSAANGTKVHLTLTPVTESRFNNLYIIAKPKNTQVAALAGISAIQFNGR